MMAFNTECYYAERRLCRMSFMLSVTNMPFMLSVIMLNVIMLSVVNLNVVAPHAGLSKNRHTDLAFCEISK